MDVYQATIICAECKQTNKVIVTREVSSAECESCSANLMRLRRFDGVIYILKNVHVKGVKIGIDRRRQRNVSSPCWTGCAAMG